MSAGNRDIYEFDRALPFGYLYDRRWDKKTIRKMNDPERVRAIVSGFYFTGETSSTEYEAPEVTEGEQISVLDLASEGYHCDKERISAGIRFYNFETDPYDPYVVWHDLDTVLDGGTLHELIVKADPESLNGEVSMACYYTTDKEADFSYDRMKAFTFTPDSCTLHIFLPAGVTDLRIDVDSEADEMIISEMTVTNYPDLEQPYQKLQGSKVTETSFTDNTYHAKTENTEAATQMLCIPLVYSQGWNAKLDGETAAVYNINGGLCGVEIPSGTHDVTLYYEIPHKAAGVALTAVGTIIYLLSFLILPLCKKKKQHS